MLGKTKFLISYDYGMGAVWGFVRAENERAIADQFPELAVSNEVPEWMTADYIAELEKSSSFELSDPATYPDWINKIIESR